jgi:hypothetical protein
MVGGLCKCMCVYGNLRINITHTHTRRKVKKTPSTLSAPVKACIVAYDAALKTHIATWKRKQGQVCVCVCV